MEPEDEQGPRFKTFTFSTSEAARIISEQRGVFTDTNGNTWRIRSTKTSHDDQVIVSVDPVEKS